MKTKLSRMTTHIIEFSNDEGTVVGKAVRTSVRDDWFVGYLTIDEKWYNAATVSSTLPEVTQRKLVTSILKGLM